MRPALLLALGVDLPSKDRAEDLPRRMLVVHVGNPLYLNPLTSNAPYGPDRVRESAARLAEALRVPTGKANNQLFILSDMLAAPDDRVLTRPAILAAVRSFCETSRRQDRVLLYFTGHAFEKDGKAYFAPIEGEPNDTRTLVPVAELYELVKNCKASQKVVVWDVCRRNPTRPAARPDGGPMTEALAKALAAVPDGVQVVLTCSPGESALEYSEPKGGARLFAGSAFLDAFRQAVEDRNASEKPEIGDLIGGDFPAIQKYVTSAATAYRAKQTARLLGNPSQPAGLNPKEAPAAPVKFLELPVATADVKSVLQELALPPLDFGGRVESLAALSALVTRDAIKPYAPDVSIDDILKDVEKYKLRAAVLGALHTIRNTALSADPKAPPPLTAVAAPITDKTKKIVLGMQEPIALSVAKLELALVELEAVADLRKNEPKRWQAHYDYTLAQVRLRVARLHEYNLLLGHIRTETLPELPVGATGWRLIPADKMQSKREVKQLAEDAADALKSLATDHKGTPWEVLAKRSLLTPPGLKWSAE
jgi:hypothetical protein